MCEILGEPLAESTRIGTFLSQVWAMWTRKVQALFPARLCLRKGIDRSGRTRLWDRCLPEATASTLGLVTLLAQLAVSSRDIPRSAFADVLHGFLQAFLREVDGTLLVLLDKDLAEGYSHPGVVAPAALCTPVSLVEGQLLFGPLVANTTGGRQVQLQHFFRNLCKKAKSPADRVPLGALLVALAPHAPLKWLLPNLLVATSILLEKAFDQVPSTTNPTSFRVAGVARQDLDLSEHLSWGKGGEGSSARATFPEQHVRSFLLLRNKKRTCKRKLEGVNLYFTRQLVLKRYLDSSRAFLKGCTDYLVLTDATRLGGKEVQLFVVGGYKPDGQLLLCWAPPMVAGQAAEHGVPTPSRMDGSEKGTVFSLKNEFQRDFRAQFQRVCQSDFRAPPGRHRKRQLRKAQSSESFQSDFREFSEPQNERFQNVKKRVLAPTKAATESEAMPRCCRISTACSGRWTRRSWTPALQG